MPRTDVSWNTVIGGYVQSGMFVEVFLAAREMEKSNINPNLFTLSSILSIFTEYVDAEKGK